MCKNPPCFRAYLEARLVREQAPSYSREGIRDRTDGERHCQKKVVRAERLAERLQQLIGYSKPGNSTAYLVQIVKEVSVEGATKQCCKKEVERRAVKHLIGC